MHITGARLSQFLDARLPECHIQVQLDPEDPRDYGFHISDRIRKEGIYEMVAPGTYAGCLGCAYEVLQVQGVKLNGKSGIQTTGGPLRFDLWTWGHHDAFTKVHMETTFADGRRSDNIQYVAMRTEAVKVALKDSGLTGDFHVVFGRLEFCGDMEAVRGCKITHHYNRLTHGVTYLFRPNKNARWSDSWGGNHLPDEATARQWGEEWKAGGAEKVCANVATLKHLFPDHPVIPKVAAFKAAEELRRAKKDAARHRRTY